MRNNQSGFIIPLIFSVVAVLFAGGAMYSYSQNKTANNTNFSKDIPSAISEETNVLQNPEEEDNKSISQNDVQFKAQKQDIVSSANTESGVQVENNTKSHQQPITLTNKTSASANDAATLQVVNVTPVTNPTLINNSVTTNPVVAIDSVSQPAANPVSPTKPIITAVSPNKANVGDTITLIGIGFAPSGAIRVRSGQRDRITRTIAGNQYNSSPEASFNPSIIYNYISPNEITFNLSKEFVGDLKPGINTIGYLALSAESYGDSNWLPFEIKRSETVVNTCKNDAPVGNFVLDASSTEAIWIKITSPNGGETAIAGQKCRITWESSPNIEVVSIGYSYDINDPGYNGNGGWFKGVPSTMPNEGYYDLDVTAMKTNGFDSNIKIHITGYRAIRYNTVSDQSDSYFTVVNKVD